MTRSPFLTERGMRSPVSVLMAPSPTAWMTPLLGFSLPVSGRKMPELVLVSGSSRRTRTLSPSGRTWTLAALGVGAVADLAISSFLLGGDSGIGPMDPIGPNRTHSYDRPGQRPR